jgi:hypothetical protein
MSSISSRSAERCYDVFVRGSIKFSSSIVYPPVGTSLENMLLSSLAGTRYGGVTIFLRSFDAFYDIIWDSAIG